MSLSRKSEIAEAWWLWLVAAAAWLVAVGHLSLEWRLNVQYQYGWAVPVLALYLVSLRWGDRPPVGARLAAGPVQAIFIALAAVVGLGILLREANPEWRLLGWLLSGAAVGLSCAAVARSGGRPWVRHFAFPILFFLTAVPWPRPQETALMMELMSGNARVAAEILRWAGHEAAVRGNVIALSTGMVGVDEACSGVRSLQSALMLSLFFGELWRLTAWRRALLFAGGIGLALCGNTLRTTWLGWVAARSGTGAVEQWHDRAGYTMLILGFLFILGFAAALRPRRPSVPENRAPLLPAPATGRIQWGAVSALVIFLASFVGTKAWFGWHESQLGKATVWRVALPRDTSGYREVTLPSRVCAELRFQHAASGAWRDAQQRRWQVSYFEWAPGSNGEQAVLVHDPRVCLQAGGMRHIATLPDVVWQRGDFQLTFEAYRFRDGARDVFVFNTVTDDVVRPGAAAERSLSRKSRWQAVAAGIRHLGQRRLEAGIWDAGSAADAQRALEDFLDHAVQIGP